MERRLYKDDYHKKIGGVCAGLAEYFNMDVTLIRVLFFATLILKGGGLLVYIILWVCLPKKSRLYGPMNPMNPNVDYRVPPAPFGDMPPGSYAVPPQPNAPFNVPANGASKGGLIAGAILVVIGGFFLLNNFDFIPDFDLENLWPLVLVGVGVAFIVSGSQRKPWDSHNWHNTPTPDADKKEEQNNDNPTTI